MVISIDYASDTLGFFAVCGRGHSHFKCPWDCLGRAQLLHPPERDALLADSEPIPTEDE